MPDPPKTPRFHEPKSPVDPFRRCLNRLLEPDMSSSLSPFCHDQKDWSSPSECWPVPGCAAGVWVLVGNLVPEQRPPMFYSLRRLHTGTPHMRDKWWQWVISACPRQGQTGAVANDRAISSTWNGQLSCGRERLCALAAGRAGVGSAEAGADQRFWALRLDWRSAVRDSGKEQGEGRRGRWRWAQGATALGSKPQGREGATGFKASYAPCADTLDHMLKLPGQKCPPQ